MADRFPEAHPYLSRGFAPIRFECDYADVPVEGDVPRALCGTFYRIGPNPQYAPRGEYNPLQGDGMIHAFRITDGRVSYRNRWVRTQQWTRERTAGRALFATSGNPRDADASVRGAATDGVANTNVVWHAGRLLALEEGHAPIDIEPDTLATVGGWSFDGDLPANMTAHPKIDPETGEMVFFANFPGRDFSGALDVFVVDARGRIARRETIRGPFPALVHDFAIAGRFAVVAFCPVTVSIARLRAGGPPLAWEPDLGTAVAVVDLERAGDVRWFTGPARMAWHTANAQFDGDAIVLDVCEQTAPAFPLADGTMPTERLLEQRLSRWTLDLSGSGAFVPMRQSEVVCEYPRIDERRLGRAYRFCFVATGGGPGTADPFHRALGRFDHATGAVSVFHAGARCAVSEPTFVARSAGAAEGEGYLLATIYDEERNASCLAVLDAERLEEGPIARAHLDHRVPVGFHGAWRAAPA